MMRKKLPIIFLIILTLVTSIAFVLPSNANAQGTPPNNGISGAQVQPQTSNGGSSMLSRIFAFESLPDLVNSIFANLANLALAGAGYILTAAAYILDVSIRLTLRIKDFVNVTPAIYTVWKTLRDITGLFFIFYLLYAAIQMMTGWGKGSYGTTIKNIFVAGILINFSFFIVSIGIDASNVVSQAIYNAMIPNSVTMRINDQTGIAEMVGSSARSDISNIFMNSLRIQSIYDTNGNKLGTDVGNPIKIIMIGISGVIMMLTTAASFVLAAIAFIARFVILIFILAFSSIWFAGTVIPEVDKALGKVKGSLMDQLLFMPAYLLLMYVALSIINGSKLFAPGKIDTLALAGGGTDWIMPYIVLAVNFAIVIIILNLPLAVGLSMGGLATGWMKKSMGKWDAMNVWKNVGLWTKDNTWKNTGGRAASAISRSEGLKNFAATNKFGELALKGVRGAAGSYDKKLESQVKARTEFASSLGMNEAEILKMKRQNTRDINEIKNKEQELRLAGDVRGADAYKKMADDLKTKFGIELAEKQKERQANYASRAGSRSVDTLFMKVARKDKAAAAKINIDVWQKQLDKKKESLTDLKKDLKQVETDIRRQEAAGVPVSSRNTDEKTKLEQKISLATRNSGHRGNIAAMGTDDLQDMIDEAKLIK